MKLVSGLLFFFLLIITSCLSQSAETDYLIKVIEGQYDEVGVPSGYVNLNGDTIIPIGKYYYCYTDTLINFAIVKRRNDGLIAIDKNDKKLFEVFWFDNGPDEITDGLFRIIIKGKIGYANEKGMIVIKPKYSCARPFENGRAQVSVHCKTISEGEHERWESESWFYIDKEGRKIN